MCQSGRTKTVLEILDQRCIPHNNRLVPMSVEINLHSEANDQLSKRTRKEPLEVVELPLAKTDANEIGSLADWSERATGSTGKGKEAAGDLTWGGENYKPFIYGLGIINRALSFRIRGRQDAWNSGTCLFMISTALSCLNGFINSLVWVNSIDEGHGVVPVWCDIATGLTVGISVAIPAASLCIKRRASAV
ncbi:pheromone A receptor-domain-containing protein [Mycena olivaceomarginata]|nr:pheromone A receptor-domain-containing protein [Mycena olivaceomarginata]